MIKVAMITRSTLYSASGGDTIQALQTARLLGNYGISIDIKLCSEAIDYSSYNLLHFFNIIRPADILYHIRKAKIPFVVSTIMVNYSEYDKYYRDGFTGMLFRYLPADAIEYLKAVSRWVLGKDRMVSLSYLWKGQKRSIREIMAKAGLLLPNSVSEYTRLKELYGCQTNYVVVPNAVDGGLFRFNSHIKKDPKLVLCVARIEGIKNQLNLIRALNNSSYQLVIIGAPAPNQLSYYHACREIAAANISFTGHLSQEELVGYYQKAKVHVLPSWFETTGLSSLEAAAMGCNIVITDKGDTKEYFGNDAVYCTPSSPENIYAAVEKAGSLPFDEKLQLKIAAHYTWQQASLRTAEGYKKTINKSWV
jgi:glycosyltransferase involved in cell wall biosynthesis